MARPRSALTGPVPGAPARGLPRLALSAGAAILLGAVTTGCSNVGDAAQSAATTSTQDSAQNTTDTGQDADRATTATEQPPGNEALPTADEPQPIPAGTYQVAPSAWSLVGYSVTVPDGWTLQYGQIFAHQPDTQDTIGFYPVVVEQLPADACPGTEGKAVSPGPGVEDLVDALRAQAGPEVSEPVADSLGGLQTTRLDLRVPEGYDLSSCNAANIGLQVWYSQPADKHLLVTPEQPVSVHILEVEGHRQVFVVEYPPDASEDTLAELETALDSIEFDL